MGLLQSATGKMARLEEGCRSGEAAWALADTHALLALHQAQQALVLPGEQKPELQLTFVQRAKQKGPCPDEDNEKRHLVCED